MATTDLTSLVFGPVPSRRLGRSLGINNIPPKSCSYSCVYCQVGRTRQPEIEPRDFYAPQEILRAVAQRIETAQRRQEQIDYLTFVPDGEPTLDAHLGETIELLRPLGIKIAVISNASLLWREDVRSRLMHVDWVSLKMDSVDEATWRRINRPHASLQLSEILHGITQFESQYPGELATETMLVEGINDSPASFTAVAEFLSRVRPHTAYLSVPTRPPAEAHIHAPSETVVNNAYQVFNTKVPHVEYLIGYEGNAFAMSGNPEQDLLSITAVHPMREDAVQAFLSRAGVGPDFLQRLLTEGKLKQVEYAGKLFYVRHIAEQLE